MTSPLPPFKGGLAGAGLQRGTFRDLKYGRENKAMNVVLGEIKIQKNKIHYWQVGDESAISG